MAARNLQTIDSAPLPYLLSLPGRAAAAPGLRPVLCFLHGYDEGAPVPIGEGVTRHGPLAAKAAPVATAEFIVVAPQLPTRGDLWHHYAGPVDEIVRQVQTQHQGDPHRTYLTGFSYGGNGVFDLALQQSGLWAALWPVDPTRVPETAPERPVWFSSGEISRRFARAFIKCLGLEPLTDAIETGVLDANDRIYVDQNQDHVGTAEHAYRDDRIYRWLLAHRRSGE